MVNLFLALDPLLTISLCRTDATAQFWAAPGDSRYGLVASSPQQVKGFRMLSPGSALLRASTANFQHFCTCIARASSSALHDHRRSQR
jgi:hypothetical protein